MLAKLTNFPGCKLLQDKDGSITITVRITPKLVRDLGSPANCGAFAKARVDDLVTEGQRLGAGRTAS